MQANMGMAGEFRVVVKRADGSIKTDTGYQKNLILDQGLNELGRTSIIQYCLVGLGNSLPTITQTTLDNPVVGVAKASGESYKNSYDQTTDGNLYRTSKTLKYVFNNLANKNITEVGLASQYSSISSYVLTTRALIKDGKGNPTTISILSGEILEIYYKLWMVIDVSDKLGVINMLDGVGNTTAYNYKVRPISVGYKNSHASVIGFQVNITNGNFNDGIEDLGLFTSELVAINGWLSGNISLAPDYYTKTASTYVNGTYKRTVSINIAVNTGNGSIRTLLLPTTVGSYQIRFGSVANDSPITKTNTQTLTIPVEISWGRYEGAL